MRRRRQRRKPNLSPSLESPLSPTVTHGTPFRAPAPAADDDEQTAVTLEEWWLEKEEGNEDGISVGGFYMKGNEVKTFTAKRIVTCHLPTELETVDGVIVYNEGSFNRERTLENGFTKEACDIFCVGFPFWCDNWKSYFPNIMSSQTISQPRSPITGNSHDNANVASASTVKAANDKGTDNDSHENEGCQKAIGSYMRRQQLHDKIVSGEATHVKSLKQGKEPARTSREHGTRLPNTIKPPLYGNPVLTRRQAKLLALWLSESPDPQVANIEADLIETKTSEENIDGHAPSASTGVCSNDKVSHINNGCQKRGRVKRRKHASEDGPSASTEVCSDDKVYVGKDNSSHISNGCEKTHVASVKRRGYLKKRKHASEDAQNLAHSDVQSSMKGKEPASTSREHDTRLPNPIRLSLYGNPHITRHKAKLLSVSVPESLKLPRTRSGRIVVPPLDAGCQNIVYDQYGSISAVKGRRGTKVCK